MLISTYQKLSENFIREMKDYVYWPLIGIYQPLSEDFILEFLPYLNRRHISSYQRVSLEFLDEQQLCKPLNNWLYYHRDLKKEILDSFNLYAMDGDYVIAYKSTRHQGFSVFNFQYQYEMGKID